MKNAKRFKAIESTLEDFEGVNDAIRTMQTKEILKLFRKAQEWEFIDQ